MWQILGGMVLGAVLGALTVALCVTASRADDMMERILDDAEAQAGAERRWAHDGALLGDAYDLHLARPSMN